jgi:hypothetical protein
VPIGHVIFISGTVRTDTTKIDRQPWHQNRQISTSCNDSPIVILASSLDGLPSGAKLWQRYRRVWTDTICECIGRSAMHD